MRLNPGSAWCYCRWHNDGSFLLRSPETDLPVTRPGIPVKEEAEPEVVLLPLHPPTFLGAARVQGQQRKGFFSALLKAIRHSQMFLQNLCFTAGTSAFSELLLCAYPLSYVSFLHIRW